MSITIDADKNMLHTVIRNLVSNALKFTHANGSIIIGAKQMNNRLHVAVTDTGVGMDIDIQNKLFKITEKVSTVETADEAGTGLGLIISKEFVEKNDGKIWEESKLGKKSVFTFTIPQQVDIQNNYHIIALFGASAGLFASKFSASVCWDVVAVWDDIYFSGSFGPLK